MKVLLFATAVSVHSQRFVNWLLDNGCQVYFVDHQNPFPSGYPGFKFIQYGLPTKCRILNKLFGPKIFSRMMASQWIIIPQLWLLGKLLRPDIIHIHYIDDRAYHCVLAGLRPLVATVWGSDINYQFLPDADPDYRRKVGFVLRHTDLVFIDAIDMDKKCAQLAGKPVRTELVTMGVNTRIFHPGYQEEARTIRCNLNINQQSRVLLSIRGWNRHYRHDAILEAFAKVHPIFNVETYLVFKKYPSSPKSDAYLSELLARSIELGINEWIRVMDEVDFTHMPAIYAFADIIINYPSVDAFPVTFLEAAACERPVLTGQLPSYVGTFAEKYFRMVKSDSIAELAEAMVEMVNEDPAKISNSLAEVRRLVEERYDEFISVKKVLKYYHELARW